jgi:hypothetical protein
LKSNYGMKAKVELLANHQKIKDLNELLDKMNVDVHRAFNEMKHLDEESPLHPLASVTVSTNAPL